MPLAIIPVGGNFLLTLVLVYVVAPGSVGLLFYIIHLLVKSPRVKAACKVGVGLVLLWYVVVAIVLLHSRFSRRRTPSSISQHGRVSTGPWLTMMGSEVRTGAMSGAFAPDVGEKVWVFRDGMLGSAFGGSPAVSGARVFVGSDDGKLHCFDAATGLPKWAFTAKHPIFASPAVEGERVYVGEGLHETQDAKLTCLDAVTGETLWAFDTTGHIEFSPTIHGGRLYFAAGDDGVYCLDKKTGRQVWRHPGIHVDLSPAVTADAVFVGSAYGETAFYALNAENGKLLWKRPTPYGVGGSPSVDHGRVYFGLGNGNFEMSHADPKGAVWCLSAEDGEPVWTRELPDSVLTCVALSGGGAFFGCRDGRVYCLDAATGEDRWAFDTGAPVLSSPAVSGPRVVVGSNTGVVHCLDARTGKSVWEVDTSTESFSADARVLASPAVGSNRVYVGSMNGAFFCLGKVEAGTAP